MVEDGLGREGGADRVLLSPGVARHRAHRDDAELEVLKAGEQVRESPALQCAWADGGRSEAGSTVSDRLSAESRQVAHRSRRAADLVPLAWLPTPHRGRRWSRG